MENKRGYSRQRRVCFNGHKEDTGTPPPNPMMMPPTYMVPQLPNNGKLGIKGGGPPSTRHASYMRWKKGIKDLLSTTPTIFIKTLMPKWSLADPPTCKLHRPTMELILILSSLEIGEGTWVKGWKRRMEEKFCLHLVYKLNHRDSEKAYLGILVFVPPTWLFGVSRAPMGTTWKHCRGTMANDCCCCCMLREIRGLRHDLCQYEREIEEAKGMANILALEWEKWKKTYEHESMRITQQGISRLCR